MLTKLHDSDGWQEALKTNGWTDAFLTGDDFTSFVKAQEGRVEEVLTKLGLV